MEGLPSGERVVSASLEATPRRKGHAEALALDEALAAQLQGMAEEAMDSKQRHAGTFEPAEGTKDVPLNPKTPDGKTLKISATLYSK